MNYNINQLTIVLSNDSNEGGEGSCQNNYSSLKSSNFCAKSERSIGSIGSQRDADDKELRASNKSKSTPDWKQGSDFPEDTAGFNLTTHENVQGSSDGSQLHGPPPLSRYESVRTEKEPATQIMEVISGEATNLTRQVLRAQSGEYEFQSDKVVSFHSHCAS